VEWGGQKHGYNALNYNWDIKAEFKESDWRWKGRKKMESGWSVQSKFNNRGFCSDGSITYLQGLGKKSMDNYLHDERACSRGLVLEKMWRTKTKNFFKNQDRVTLGKRHFCLGCSKDDEDRNGWPSIYIWVSTSVEPNNYRLKNIKGKLYLLIYTGLFGSLFPNIKYNTYLYSTCILLSILSNLEII
jgi:hypothetical protein